MEGCEVCEGFEMVIRVMVDDFGFAVVAAMYDSMAGYCYIFLLGDGCHVFVVDQLIQHELEGISLAVYFRVDFFAFAY